MIESLQAYKKELQGLKIRRTREIRWYDDKGARYTDLWQNGGRALFGYRPSEIKKSWESALAKGINIPFSGVYGKRLEKIPEILGFGGYQGTFFPSETDMTTWFLKNKLDSNDISFFRPYSSDLPTIPAVLRVILPNPFTNSELILSKEGLIPSDFSCPASEVVLLVKICHEINANRPFFEQVSIPREFSQKFKISGPYMHFSGTEEAYAGLVCKAFSRGFIFPPDMKEPTIFSPFLSENEKKNLVKVLGE